jgi:hypothetical protein
MITIIVLLSLILIGIVFSNFWLLAIFSYLYNRDKNNLTHLYEKENM